MIPVSVSLLQTSGKGQPSRRGAGWETASLWSWKPAGPSEPPLQFQTQTHMPILLTVPRGSMPVPQSHSASLCMFTSEHSASTMADTAVFQGPGVLIIKCRASQQREGSRDMLSLRKQPVQAHGSETPAGSEYMRGDH